MRVYRPVTFVYYYQHPWSHIRVRFYTSLANKCNVWVFLTVWKMELMIYRKTVDSNKFVIPCRILFVVAAHQRKCSSSAGRIFSRALFYSFHSLFTYISTWGRPHTCAASWWSMAKTHAYNNIWKGMRRGAAYKIHRCRDHKNMFYSSKMEWGVNILTDDDAKRRRSVHIRENYFFTCSTNGGGGSGGANECRMLYAEDNL